MKNDSISFKQIAECIQTTAQEFAPQKERARIWQRAASSTWLACSRRKQKQPRFLCLMCYRPRWYGLKTYCEQCDRHARIIKHRAQRRKHLPGSQTLYK